jgi:hypothetical protein
MPELPPVSNTCLGVSGLVTTQHQRLGILTPQGRHLLPIPLANGGETGELLKRWRTGVLPNAKDVDFNDGREALLTKLILDQQFVIAIDQMVPLLFIAETSIYQQGPHGDWCQLAEQCGEGQLTDPTGPKQLQGEGTQGSGR